MIDAYAYTEEDNASLETFKALSDIEKKGFWDNTHGGESALTRLKGRIKDHYVLAQDYTCPYCQQRNEVTHLGVWDAEHIIPKDTHPQFMFEAQNLCVSCKDCNGEKLSQNILKNPGRKTFPTASDDYLISHPHFDIYHDHIKIISAAGYYLPRTDKGRKTVEICGLLRFLYKFAGQGELGSAEIAKELGELHSELLVTKDIQRQHAILSLIAEIAEAGAKARLAMMRKNTT